MTSKTMNALSLSKSDGTVECAIVDLVGMRMIRIGIQPVFPSESEIEILNTKTNSFTQIVLCFNEIRKKNTYSGKTNKHRNFLITCIPTISTILRSVVVVVFNENDIFSESHTKLAKNRKNIEKTTCK